MRISLREVGNSFTGSIVFLLICLPSFVILEFISQLLDGYPLLFSFFYFFTFIFSLVLGGVSSYVQLKK